MSLSFGDLPVPQMWGFAFGVAVAVYGALLWERAAASRRWPATRGRIQRAVVREHVDRTGGGDGATGAPTPVYRAEVTYEYAAGGREYLARRVDLLDRAASWRSAAEAVVARYPAGREVTVYYDPEDPRQAVLERDAAPAWAAGVTAAGAAIALGSLAWAFVASRAT